jgi:hypothetical protein
MAKKKPKRRVIDPGNPEIVPWKSFEAEVADFMEKSIPEGKWGVCPNLARVLRKPKYYSKERGKDIEFDVSVEVRPIERPEEIVFLWLIECKKYDTRKVKVDEVEELRSKMYQVGAHKGMIFTKVGFEAGTIAYAKTHRIGLSTLRKELLWTLQFSQSGGAFGRVHIMTPFFLDETEKSCTLLMQSLIWTLSPFGIRVLDIHVGEENIAFDGPLEYTPLEEGDAAHQ